MRGFDFSPAMTMTFTTVTSPQPLPLALIADADASSREMYVESMKLANWAVVEAVDGPQALAIALNRRPDLIIADTHLPGISGRELCDVLRRDLATRGTPIVLITSDTMARELERLRASGASGVMTKPCLPEALLDESVRLLEISRAAGQPWAGAADARSPFADAARRLPEVRPRRMSRTHLRGETDAPPSSPPELICPECDRPLDYKSSQVGGVSARYTEQWDYFVCGVGCGTFQYRQRTRKLRKM
jgi:CheY-like chemotaxis protein